MALTKEAVQKVVNEQIAPRLAMDGGSIELVDVTAEGVVMVRPKGACSCCPGWKTTLQMGVTRILKEALPGVKSVETA